MSKKIDRDMAFDMKKLNKIFAVLSVVLLVVVIWVFLDDYMRPWKIYQLEGMKVKREQIDGKLKKELETLDASKVKKLEESLKRARASVSMKKKDIDKINAALKKLSQKIKHETLVNGKLNSKVSASVFKYGVAHYKKSLDERELFEEMTVFKDLLNESKDRAKKLKEDEKKLKKQLLKLNDEVIVATEKIRDLFSAKDRLTSAKNSLEFNGIFILRNLPFIDFLDPTLKIQQIVLENITDDRYFRQVDKVDRCITCHTLIDQAGFEDQKNPHKTHPRLDLMVGIQSKHPMKKFGCTVCHGGEGQRVTDFNSIAHTPSNERQRKEWIKKYSWHSPHRIPSKMLKLHNTESSCFKCHKGVERIDEAFVVGEGRKNIKKFGCFACHQMEGWEDKGKPGPSLKKIAGKIDKSFFKAWVWSPKNINIHAKMPSFFNLSNNKDEIFQRKNIVEINTMAEYIWSRSKKYRAPFVYTKGSTRRGKQLIKEIGCLSCHGVEGLEEDSQKIKSFKGTYLTKLGSKVDHNWLVSWLIDPQHYQETTIMPSFRLSQKEANDIATYLLSFKDPNLEELFFEPLDRELRDHLLVDLFTTFQTKDGAHKKLNKMSEREKTLELGFRSLGKYGCYSCHDIDGFEGRSPIGPKLSSIGSKPLTQFNFAHEHNREHSRDGWINAHLLDPRRWDVGVDKSFKDLLKMPSFHMTKEEARSITTVLLGYVEEKIPLKGVKRLNSSEVIVARGEKIVEKFNCMGCHKIDGVGGDLLSMQYYEDDLSMAPPPLIAQGEKVKADWLHSFLGDVVPIRPWLKVRMPSFDLTNTEKNYLVAMFQAKAKQETFEDDQKIVWKKGEKREVKKLFVNLACASCHTIGFNDEEPTAPDLHLVKKRLRKNWIKKWLKNPQSIVEETTMPSFWEDGISLDETTFNGDSERQIEALVKYLMELGE